MRSATFWASARAQWRRGRKVHWPYPRVGAASGANGSNWQTILSACGRARSCSGKANTVPMRAAMRLAVIVTGGVRIASDCHAAANDAGGLQPPWPPPIPCGRCGAHGAPSCARTQRASSRNRPEARAGGRVTTAVKEHASSAREPAAQKLALRPDFWRFGSTVVEQVIALLSLNRGKHHASNVLRNGLDACQAASRASPHARHVQRAKESVVAECSTLPTQPFDRQFELALEGRHPPVRDHCLFQLQRWRLF